MVDIVPTFVMI